MFFLYLVGILDTNFWIKNSLELTLETSSLPLVYLKKLPSTIDGCLLHIVTSSDYDSRSNYIEKFMFLYLIGILDTNFWIKNSLELTLATSSLPLSSNF